MPGISKAEKLRQRDLFSQGLKHCRNCDKVKPHNDFHRNVRLWDGYTGHCKVCACDRSSRWHEDNQDRARDYKQQWHLKNRERLLPLSREAEQARRDADPLYTRLKSGASEARKHGNLVEKFTSADLLAYWQSVGIDPTRCYYSGEELGPVFHLDHMTPLARGGAHAVWNLAPCTVAANSSKKHRTAEEYLSGEPASYALVWK